MDTAQTKEKIQKLTEKRKSAKIIKYLDSNDKEIVIAALHGLSQIGDEDSRNVISKLIDSEEPKIRIEAAKALGNQGGEYAKSYLQHRMSKEKDSEVKQAIMDSLKGIAVNR